MLPSTTCDIKELTTRDVRGTQVDLQLESGEYFLKPTERKRREESERKQKVCFRALNHPCGTPL